MALLNNMVLGELSGKLGNKVFRVMNGKNFVSDRPLNYKPAKTPAAKKVRSSFGTAVELSKKLITDPMLKEVWASAKIAGFKPYNKIIKHNIKLINSGTLTERNKITPDGLFLNLDSASFQNETLHLSLLCPADSNLSFPAKLSILYYFRKANQSLVLTQTTIPEGAAGGIYELDVKPAKVITRLINENPDALLYVSLVSETIKKKKPYWTSSAAAGLS